MKTKMRLFIPTVNLSDLQNHAKSALNHWYINKPICSQFLDYIAIFIIKSCEKVF